GAKRLARRCPGGLLRALCMPLHLGPLVPKRAPLESFVVAALEDFRVVERERCALALQPAIARDCEIGPDQSIGENGDFGFLRIDERGAVEMDHGATLARSIDEVSFPDGSALSVLEGLGGALGPGTRGEIDARSDDEERARDLGERGPFVEKD